MTNLKSKSTQEAIKRWWNNNSRDYQEFFNIPTDDIFYGPFCPPESELKLIDLKKIKNYKVLELGCGGGQISIYLSKNGAVCEGVDLSEKQIEYADKLSSIQSTKTKFYVRSSDDLGIFEDNSFDFVISVFSFQYIENLDKLFKEIRRVLKPGGRLIFSFDHPFYTLLSTENLKLVKNYHKLGLERNIKTEDVVGNSINNDRFLCFFRKIEDYCKSIKKAGLILKDIIEPEYSNSKTNPWSKIYSNKLAKLVPATIIIEVYKNL